MDIHENALLTLRRREELVQHVHAQVSYAELSRELGLSQHLYGLQSTLGGFLPRLGPQLSSRWPHSTFRAGSHSTRSWTLCAGRLVYGTTSSLGDGATADKGR